MGIGLMIRYGVVGYEFCAMMPVIHSVGFVRDEARRRKDCLMFVVSLASDCVSIQPHATLYMAFHRYYFFRFLAQSRMLEIKLVGTELCDKILFET